MFLQVFTRSYHHLQLHLLLHNSSMGIFTLNYTSLGTVGFA